ncbi:MAG: hypothetical protein R6V52_06460 [Bacteroidales bacterium]
MAFLQQDFDADTVQNYSRKTVDLSVAIVGENRRVSRSDLSLSDACDWMHYCEQVHHDWDDDWLINGVAGDRLCLPVKN